MVGLSWRCQQLLYGFLANGHIPRVSLLSNLSANDRADNEMKPGNLHRSPGIFLNAEENPHLGDRLTKAVRPVIASNGLGNNLNSFCDEIRNVHVSFHLWMMYRVELITQTHAAGKKH